MEGFNISQPSKYLKTLLEEYLSTIPKTKGRLFVSRGYYLLSFSYFSSINSFYEHHPIKSAELAKNLVMGEMTAFDFELREESAWIAFE